MPDNIFKIILIQISKNFCRARDLTLFAHAGKFEPPRGKPQGTFNSAKPTEPASSAKLMRAWDSSILVCDKLVLKNTMVVSYSIIKMSS